MIQRLRDGVRLRRFIHTRVELSLKPDGIALQLGPHAVPMWFYAGAAFVGLGGIGVVALIVMDPQGGSVSIGPLTVVGTETIPLIFGGFWASLILVLMAAPTVVPLRLRARIIAGTVQVTERPWMGLGRRRWEEPMTAYRSLHASVVYTEGKGRGSSCQTTVSGQCGLLVLEHAKDAARNLLLGVRPEGPIKGSYAQDIAARLGVTLHRSP